MNLTEKRRFIRSLTKAVTANLIASVSQMPPEWDGIELRELIADKFDNERILSTRSHCLSSSHLTDKRRLRAYRNEKLTHNL